jgi:RNA polymerase primary sigma factor
MADQLTQLRGRRPSVEETAEAVGMSVAETTRAMSMTRAPLSLDQMIGDQNENYLGEIIEDPRCDDPLHRINRDSLRSGIADALAALDYREREILRLRFGLTDGYPYTLSEVGAVFFVTRERVRQIEIAALRKLQQPSRARSLSEFLERPVYLPPDSASDRDEPGGPPPLQAMPPSITPGSSSWAV